MTNENERTILRVPYAEKNEAKDLGAKWDPEIKKWFVPKGKKLDPFTRWMEQQAER